MPQSATVNRRIVLNARPVGAPTAADFRMEDGVVPAPASGQVLLRTHYLSLDPYMRGRMSDGPSYAAPVAIGDVMVGGTVSRVEVSRHSDFSWASTFASTTGATTSPGIWQPGAPKASMSTSRTSVAPCSMPCCRC